MVEASKRRKRHGYVALVMASILGAGCRDSDRHAASMPASVTDQELGIDEVAPTETSASVRVDDRSRRLAIDEAIRGERWQEALDQIRRQQLATPDDVELMRMSAICLGRLGRKHDAADAMVDYIQRKADFDMSAIQLTLQALIDVGRLFEAIELLEGLTQRHPDQIQLRRLIVGFLGEAEMTDPVGRHLAALIRAGQFDAALLMTTTDQSSRRFANSTLEVCRQRNPDDLRLNLPEAKDQFRDGDYEAARSILQSIVDRHPAHPASLALLLRAAAAAGQPATQVPALQRLVNDPKLLASLENSPDFWFGVGQWFQSHQRWADAAASFLKGLQLRPNDTGAWIRLAVICRSSDEPDSMPAGVDAESIAEEAQRRVDRLLELRKRFFRFAASQRTSFSDAVAISGLLQELGRMLEARAWSFVARDLLNQNQPEERRSLQRLLSQLREVDDLDQWQATDRWPSLAYKTDPIKPSDLAELLDRSSPADLMKTDVRVTVGESTDGSNFVLQDVAKAVGLDFYGEIGSRVLGPHVPLAETTGCGVAALDFDLDGRDDLALTSAGGTIGQNDSAPNALYRNLVAMIDGSSTSEDSIGGVDVNGDGFRIVKSGDWSSDRHFGQGVVVVDYNQDGFPDLMSMNIGPNQIFRNNGDGTYRNVTSQVAPADPGLWSTSGMAADVDRDGLIDLVTCNYAAADQDIDQPCLNPATGEEVSCHPLIFDPSPDQFWKGTADGRFVDVSSQWGRDLSPALGLGVIAGGLTGSDLQIFVANDMSANHLLSGEIDRRGNFRLVDSAALRGIAVDARGLTQASMGIAALDHDRNGQLDLYVTGFAREYNILASQQSPGMWNDQTQNQDLVSPTLPYVGFGTQSLDLNNDMSNEIFVSNGHIGDFGPEFPPYFQPPQLLYQTSIDGRSVFREAGLGDRCEYFAESHVGRAVAKLDFDNDYQTDLIVTHATKNVSLLQNQTNSGLGAVKLTLVGTSGSRDAVGSVIDVTPTKNGETMARTRVWQLAGDGYLCRNSSTHTIGLADADEASIAIQWPDHSTSQTLRVEPGRSYLFVEGQSEAFWLDGP